METQPGVHTLERESDPTPRAPRDWSLAVSMSLLAVVLTIIGMYQLQPKRERYSMFTVNAGIVARCDRTTGEIVFVSMNGAEAGRYPKPPFDPDEYLQAKP